MNHQSLRSRAIALVTGIVLLAASAFASADPPSQVIRLGFTTGAVSFSPAGEDDWVRATLNRPLTIGDRIWVDSGARAELQVGGSMMRLNGPSGITVLNLEDNLAQLQLTQGAMNVRVRHLDPDQVIEIDTPNVAFTLRQPGSYRLFVDTDGNSTDVIVRNGRAEVYGEGASYVLDSRQSYRFYDTRLQDYEQYAAPRFDEFDRWASDRDRRFDASVSARYVSPDVIGYQDLDTYGSWNVDATYGNVWYPTRVAADWAPYRDGHWVWVDPWGWTWVDDAPWGFAVSHYGRWAHVGGRWGWVPGPVRTRAYYAPALVAFVGGSNFSLSISTGNVGAVGWFPLGPREVYRPWYSASRRYFEQVNVSNTVVNTTVINNYYNNTNVTNVNYVNRQVPGAVVAVPTTAFVQAQPVQRAAVQVTQQVAASAPVAPVAAVAPTERSVRGAAAQSGAPPARVFQREVVARRAPAPTPVNFAAQQQQLEKQPGRPLDEAARKEVRAAPATPAPQVKVVQQAQSAPPTAVPPAAAPGKGEARMRGRPGAPGEAPQPPATAEKGTPPQVAQPAPGTQPSERGKGQERGKGAERGQPADGTAGTLATPAQPRAGSPAQTRIQEQQARQAEQQQARQAAQQAQQEQQVRQAEQQKAREAQAAQQQQTRQSAQQARQEQQARQAEQQQARQAEQQKAREAQAAQQQQRQTEQQKARDAQAAQQQQRQAEQQQQRQAEQARQQQARQAQAEQQQARQAAQQQARQAQQAEQQQARQAQQAEQQQGRQAAQQQARQAQTEQQQARQAQPPQQGQQQQAQQPQPRQEQEARGRGKDKDEDQRREEEARKQRG